MRDGYDTRALRGELESLERMWWYECCCVSGRCRNAPDIMRVSSTRLHGTMNDSRSGAKTFSPVWVRVGQCIRGYGGGRAGPLRCIAGVVGPCGGQPAAGRSCCGKMEATVVGGGGGMLSYQRTRLCLDVEWRL